MRLTITGKIQIVQFFAIPKFMSKAAVIFVSNDLVKEVNKELYHFIWNGKDKIKQVALINDIEDGGLKMLDIECMIRAQRIICLKKYIEDYISPWKFVLDYYLEKVGGNFILQCHFDYRNLPITLPMFYKDCLKAWSYLTTKEVVSYQDIMNQVVWNNKYILSLGKSIYQPFFRNHGLNKVGDLVSKDHIFLKSTKILGA